MFKSVKYEREKERWKNVSQPGAEEGDLTTKLRWDLRLDPQTRKEHEWENGKSLFRRSGVSLRVLY